MTGEQEARLRALIAALSTSPDAPSFTRPFGDAEPGGRGLRLELDGGPYAALDVRPWSPGATGVVLVELRPDVPPPSWADVEARFGPFSALSRPGSRDERYAAVIESPGAGAASLLLSVRVTGDTVDEIALRRDPT